MGPSPDPLALEGASASFSSAAMSGFNCLKTVGTELGQVGLEKGQFLLTYYGQQ
jgi:hypothetical protein